MTDERSGKIIPSPHPSYVSQFSQPFCDGLIWAHIIEDIYIYNFFSTLFLFLKHDNLSRQNCPQSSSLYHVVIQISFYFFCRLKSITTESSVIVTALQKSKTGLVEISEDKTKIRRSPDKPLPDFNDEYKDAVKHKSVYMVRSADMSPPNSQGTINFSSVEQFFYALIWHMF